LLTALRGTVESSDGNERELSGRELDEFLSRHGSEQLLREVDDLTEMLTELRIVLIHRLAQADGREASGSSGNGGDVERRAAGRNGNAPPALCEADDEYWYL
jgi:hypothetical protein